MAETIGPGYYRVKVSEGADENLVTPLVSQFLLKVSSAIKVASEKSTSDDSPLRRSRLEKAEG